MDRHERQVDRRVDLPFVGETQVDDGPDAVLDERPPTGVGQAIDVVRTNVHTEVRLAAGLGRMAAEIADVVQSLPVEISLLHYAATSATCSPRSVVDVLATIRTGTSSPAAAVPEKLTVVLRRVRPRRMLGSVLLAPSTSTSSTAPIRSAFRGLPTAGRRRSAARPDRA